MSKKTEAKKQFSNSLKITATMWTKISKCHPVNFFLGLLGLKLPWFLVRCVFFLNDKNHDWVDRRENIFGLVSCYIYLLLCNKLPPTITVILCSCWGSETQKLRSWVSPTQVVMRLKSANLAHTQGRRIKLHFFTGRVAKNMCMYLSNRRSSQLFTLCVEMEWGKGIFICFSY